MAEVTFHMTVGLKETRYPHMGLKIPKITKGKPSIPRGEIALKFQLRIPDSLFQEFIPSGLIEIPEDAEIGRPTLTVEVPENMDLTDPGVRLQLVPIREED